MKTHLLGLCHELPEGVRFPEEAEAEGEEVQELVLVPRGQPRGVQPLKTESGKNGEGSLAQPSLCQVKIQRGLELDSTF